MLVQNGISVIVCTYNRKNILKECLDALSSLYLNSLDYEVIVVNNYPKESLEHLISLYKNRLNIKLINEPKPGLSIARNFGLRHATYSWVSYIDDDAKAKANWLTLAQEIINEHHFDCFGGMYLPWWKYDKPHWMSPDYGSKPKLSIARAEIKSGYNWGSNIFFKKEKLVEVGGFPEHLGMKANGIGYAEETFVQQKFRSLGLKIGFDPELIVYHLVGKHKLSPNWHIKAAYADARDQRITFPENYTASSMLLSIVAIFVNPVKAIFKLTTRKKYFIQNLFIDSCSPLLSFIGKIVAITR